MKKIIVAGAGDAGLITAAILSKNGFHVELIEKNNIDNICYNWVDVFNIRPFNMLNIPLTNYEIVKPSNITIHNGLYKIINKDNSKRVKMNRRDLRSQLIKYATDCNVKIKFNCDINDILIKNNKVVGIRTDNGNMLCDLVIDSCGIDSILRRKLPKSFGIANNIKDFFYTYRGFYYKDNSNVNHNILIIPNKGISWIIEDNNYIDLLISSKNKLNNIELNLELEKLKKINNIIEDLKIVDKYYKIPLRYSLSQMISNGYVLIGDSACMTVPITGSGLSLCALSSKILTDILIKNMEKDYNKELLWEYQVEYFKTVASSLNSLYVFKESLLKMSEKDINFIFKNLDKYANIKFTPLKNSLIIIKNISSIKFIRYLSNILLLRNKVKNITRKIPKVYDASKVNKWKREYDQILSNLFK